MRVLTVENSCRNSLSAREMMKASSILVEVVETGEEVLELARLYDYDIILLPLTLTDMSGHDVLRRLRSGRIGTPVLVLTTSSQAAEKIKCFTIGADDVLESPFDPAELLARVQAIVRRAKGFSQPVLSIGALTLCLLSQEVTVGGRAINLTSKEYAILELLALRKGMVMTKQMILDHLYGGMDEPEVKIIDVFICNLRKKLARAGADGLIDTVWGRGYTLKAPERIASRPSSSSAPAAYHAAA